MSIGRLVEITFIALDPSRQPLRGFLRMRARGLDLKSPHAEELAKQASRSTRAFIPLLASG
jgi:hypothetical protein